MSPSLPPSQTEQLTVVLSMGRFGRRSVAADGRVHAGRVWGRGACYQCGATDRRALGDELVLLRELAHAPLPRPLRPGPAHLRLGQLARCPCTRPRVCLLLSLLFLHALSAHYPL